MKLENKQNKETRSGMGERNPKNKNVIIKINLMIERDRQKNSAPIAKRVSGDGAFCLFNSFIFVWNLFSGMCHSDPRSGDDL